MGSTLRVVKCFHVAPFLNLHGSAVGIRSERFVVVEKIRQAVHLYPLGESLMDLPVAYARNPDGRVICTAGPAIPGHHRRVLDLPGPVCWAYFTGFILSVS